MVGTRKAFPEIAGIQVLVARYGDRTPRMLSGERPVEEQLEQIARDFGEKHVTINGRPYKEFAEEYGLERRGDAELPWRAGITTASTNTEDPEQTLDANREAGIHNAENFNGNILPGVDGSAEEDARLAEMARSKEAEDSKLQQALKRDNERKAEERANPAVQSQLTKQVSEQSGMGTGGQGSGPDMREAADKQEEKSDAELQQLRSEAEERGDTATVDEIDRYIAMTNEDRVRNRPIVDADGSVRVASRDPNELANKPPEKTAPLRDEQFEKELTQDPVERRDVEQMSKADLKAELDEYGAGYETDANKTRLAEQVTEERAKRQSK